MSSNNAIAPPESVPQVFRQPHVFAILHANPAIPALLGQILDCSSIVRAYPSSTPGQGDTDTKSIFGLLIAWTSQSDVRPGPISVRRSQMSKRLRSPSERTQVTRDGRHVSNWPHVSAVSRRLRRCHDHLGRLCLPSPPVALKPAGRSRVRRYRGLSGHLGIRIHGTDARDPRLRLSCSGRRSRGAASCSRPSRCWCSRSFSRAGAPT